MSGLSIKKGNKKIWTVEIKDSNGDIVTNLSTASEIFYMIKSNREDLDSSALVTKTMTGGHIAVDTPSSGSLQITVNSTDTEDIDPGTYYHAVEIQYAADNRQEVDLSTTDVLKIIQDVIRG